MHSYFVAAVVAVAVAVVACHFPCVVLVGSIGWFHFEHLSKLFGVWRKFLVNFLAVFLLPTDAALPNDQWHLDAAYLLFTRGGNINRKCQHKNIKL